MHLRRDSTVHDPTAIRSTLNNDAESRLRKSSYDAVVVGSGFAGAVAACPVISDEQIEQALADPFRFSLSGWMLAVAYPGTTWKQVASRGCGSPSS
jgi:hypothetical protein